MTVQAPTATIWQNLYDLYWTLAIVAGAISIGALVFFAVRYRTRPGTLVPSTQIGGRSHRTAVIVVVLTMALVLGSAAFESFQAIGVYENPPNDPNAIHVNVVGARFSWNFTCASGCGVPGVLTVPANTVVILNITSSDVFHSFGIQALRVKADAIPGRFNTLWFKAAVGTYRIQCFELCGNGHAFMIAKLNVV